MSPLPDPAPDGLVLTGERTLPGLAEENYWFRRHEAAYRWLAPFTRGAVVLEAGCGEGYGSDLLAVDATTVVALDYDGQTTRHVRRRYPDLGVVRGDLQRLPVADGAVEVVANLQVLEHLHDQAGFLVECARVLRPAGTLLLTTPNRWTFSPGHVAGQPHLNPFHTRELDPDELRAVLEPRFDVVRLAGLAHGRRLRRLDSAHAGQGGHGGLVDAQIAGLPPTWSSRLRADVAGVSAGDFVVSEDDVAASLDLVAVAVRRPTP